MTLHADDSSHYYGAQQPPLTHAQDDVSMLGPRLLFNFGEGNMHTLENFRPLLTCWALAVAMAALLLFKLPNL